MRESTSSHDEFKEKHTSTQTALTANEDLLQSLLTGLSSNSINSSGGGGYLGQLADAKARIAQGTAEEERTRRKLSLREKELAELEVKWKKVEKEAGDGRKSLEAARKELEVVRRKVEVTNWDLEKDAQMETEMRQAKSNVRVMAEVRFRYERGDLLTYHFLAEARCDPPTAFQLGFPVFGSDPTL